MGCPKVRIPRVEPTIIWRTESRIIVPLRQLKGSRLLKPTCWEGKAAGPSQILINYFITSVRLGVGVLGFWGFGEIGRAHV